MKSNRVKRLAKLIISNTFTGLAGKKLLPRKSPLILMYHRVLPAVEALNTWSSPYIVTHLDSFAAQMAYLAENCHFFSPSELAGPVTLPPGSVAVTFDDGWADNHLHALPILTKNRIRATFFLTAGLINTEQVFLPEKLRCYLHLAKKENFWSTVAGRSFLSEAPRSIAVLAPFADPDLLIQKLWHLDASEAEAFLQELHRVLGRPEIDVAGHRLMKWQEVLDLKQDGMELGSHGLNHTRLTGLADRELFQELNQSKSVIEKAVKAKVNSFAYPKGDHDTRVRKTVREAGYLSACDTREGFVDRKHDLMALPRLNVCESRFSDHRGRFSPEMFRAALGGLI